jgi:hypothetical protein
VTGSGEVEKTGSRNANHSKGFKASQHATHLLRRTSFA